MAGEKYSERNIEKYSEQIDIVSIIGMAAGAKFTLPSQNKHYNIRDMVTLFMGENRQEPVSAWEKTYLYIYRTWMRNSLFMQRIKYTLADIEKTSELRFCLVDDLVVHRVSNIARSWMSREIEVSNRHIVVSRDW